MTVNELKSQLNEVLESKTNNESAKLCRQLLSKCIEYIFNKENKPIPKNATLLEMVDSPVVSSYIIEEPDLVNNMHYVRILGMNAEHGLNIRKRELELAQENISHIVRFLDSKENGERLCYESRPYMSEANTRKLYIDLYLKEAGWDILETENSIVPAKACIEIRVEGMPNNQGFGFCDYVLYGKDGRPLAIVEAKKTSKSPEVGRHQVDLYAECMKAVYGYKPIMYYTNGYRTRIIDGIYPDRDVMAFHSLEDLERMLHKRNEGKITDFSINDEITNRPYQKIAITKICEWFNSNRRRGLLVMATGTGKTRVSISLVDILTRNKKIKNVLFLADRTALVNQAKKDFAKLLPSMIICELSASGEKDFNARLMFCTYQTMINYIDSEDKRFSTGRFDLIIIDEAHRSIFNRYGSIFKYFDSLLVGLTATPKEEVDANTFQIFGCEAGIPNYDYSLEDGIRDKYLVGYTVRNRSSKMLSAGIDFKALTYAERTQLDDYLIEIDEELNTLDIDQDIKIPKSVIFKYLYNKDTCIQVVEELMQWGLRVEGGETLGKTIIFAFNHKHAQMIVDVFHELYPEYPSNTCQLVDYYTKYGDNLVDKFKEDSSFRIAVSVDMLDTGVDVPEVLNLVFFKKVRSKIKFIQMIGRGTRLCKDIFGPGRNKTEFQIFDYCGNFEFFNVHQDGTSSKEILTVSQRLFNVRLDMLYELQRLEYQENEDMLQYYRDIKEELLSYIVTIKTHSARIQVRDQMPYVDKYCNRDSWISLSPVLIKEIKKHLTHLVDSGVRGCFLSLAFDLRIYLIELDILKTQSVVNSKSHIIVLRKSAQFLLTKRASVPQVISKAEDLKRLLSDGLWKKPTITELESLRLSLRDLMNLLQGSERGRYDIDIEDVISEADYIPENTSIDIRTYREKVIDYLESHSDNPVIKKIHNLEPISSEDLKLLEEVLWHELGSQDDYAQTTSIQNLAAFVRSLIGLSQDAVNEKFGKYLNTNTFNSQQQEFILTIINYVRENGDIELKNIVNNEPFNNYNITEMFGESLPAVKEIVNVLHLSVVAKAA